MEYIIIDGGSNDGTQEIVNKYIDGIVYYVSEPDGGIYFGMNKGIDVATGDYTIFLNAGDVFADEQVLAETASYININPDSDIVFGNSEQSFEYGSFIVKPKQKQISERMSISHQASFVRTRLLREHKFDTRYRYASDYEQISFFYYNGAHFSYFDRLISKVEMEEGATFNHFIKSTDEMFDIIASRGIDVSRKRKRLIRRKKIIRALKDHLPPSLRTPLFRFIAKHYKAL